MRKILGIISLICILLASCNQVPRPNIVFILTDDQGWADISCHGNLDTETPTLDRLANSSVELTNYYVSPLCSPTRASLMSGQYAYRTNVVSTGHGLSSINPEIKTMAERLKDYGYSTALFGKWHLGDVYPHRAQDQGFDEVLTHINGNLSAYPPFNPYLNPILIHNGTEEQHSGYCMDIYTNHAIKYIRKNKNKPFFIYLPTNTPHRPLEITDEYLAKYKAKGLKDQTARVYAMVENIDHNVRRIEQAIENEGLKNNTIFIFMNDNGPTSLEDDRYLANYRGKKSFVYEGGIKAICFIRYPDGFKGHRKLTNLSAHIDILPTLLDLCGIPYDSNDFDGLSLAPLLRGETTTVPERLLFWQSHEGMPQFERSFAVRRDSFKLVQQNVINGSFDSLKDKEYELFNLILDPYEKKNLVEVRTKVKEELLDEYKRWFYDVTAGNINLPYTIQLEPSIQDPLVLTRRDWLGTKGIQDHEIGHWIVNAQETTDYTMEVSIRRTLPDNALIAIECDSIKWQTTISRNKRSNNIPKVTIPAGSHRITGKVYTEGKLIGGVHYIKLTRRND